MHTDLKWDNTFKRICIQIITSSMCPHRSIISVFVFVCFVVVVVLQRDTLLLTG